MKINQLSVFLENKPGKLSVPCKTLADAGINILTLSLADTLQFGILRLIVKDWEKAREALVKAGCVVNVTEVIAVDVPDKPGGLANILAVIEKADMNLEYMYAFTIRIGEKAALLFRFEEPDAAIKLLRDNGYDLISSTELFS